MLPVVVGQVLSERLWHLTLLGQPTASVTALHPGAPNSHLKITSAWWDDKPLPGRLALPVVTIEPRSLARWAKMLVSGDSSPAVLLSTAPIAEPVRPPVDALDELDADERVKRFRHLVSETAFRLAVYLSGAPLQLSVMRLVQRVMLPTSSIEHLSEVLLGGIVRRLPTEGAGLGDDEIEFEFYVNVRDLLQGEINRTELFQVLDATSSFISDHIGQPCDFRALITDVFGEEKIPEKAIPFAHIAKQALKRFGIRPGPGLWSDYTIELSDRNPPPQTNEAFTDRDNKETAKVKGSKLTKLSQERKEEFVGDVIFVHGMDGDSKSTWVTANGKSSWAQWFSEDRPDLCVWSFDYSTKGLSWLGSATQLPLRAIDFLARLVNENFGERPICFVAHSLGGMVVKQLLREAVVHPSNTTKSIADAVRGVVFIATPHIGSTLAKLVYKLRYLTRPTSVIADLRPGIGLHSLNEWYRDYVVRTNVKTLIFSENKQTRGLADVVDFISADAGIPGVRAINTDFDHIEICKPRDKNNIVYSGTVRFLDEVFVPRMIFNIPHPENKYFTGQEEIISQIRQKFEAGESVQSLTGIGGIGKTQIAVTYAYKFCDQYQTVLWIRAQSRETLVSDFADAAVMLNLLEKNEPDQMLAFNVLREWLGKIGRASCRESVKI